MANNLYWVITLILAVQLLLILINDYRMNSLPNRLEKSFRMMVLWVMFFALQDTLWGFCESGVIKSDGCFYISSSIFHISTVITTFFWLYYMLEYLGERIKRRKLYLFCDILLIFIEVMVIIYNIFCPVVFEIQDGQYITCILRPMTFINQYLVYLFIGIATLIFALKERKGEREEYMMVFVFSLAPILLGIFQLLYPEGPFYSIGYFLGCFVVHIFIVSKDREEISRSKVLKSLADMYYSMHVLDLKTDTIERVLEIRDLTEIIGNTSGAQEMLNKVADYSITLEHLEMVREFLDLRTLPERMKEKNNLSGEFLGTKYGWCRITFISIEKENDSFRKVMIAVQLIDEEKKSRLQLQFQSNHDELTGLLNRRAYEEELERRENEGIGENFVYISMDVNGLKNVNDNQGHAAGDEMIRGAANCMVRCFGSYGKVYRTGGDEFSAILDASSEQLERVKDDFENIVAEWSGELVSSLSVSCGYVTAEDAIDHNMHEISILGDERMYKEKNEYYKKKGVDRRGQKDAHVALCTLYTKILKLNITNDTFQIIDMDEMEQTPEKGCSESISGWFIDFATSGNVHPDDIEEFLAKTNISYMRQFFGRNKNLLSIKYRRKYGASYAQTVMDIIPANDYTPDEQKLFLYVKRLYN